MYAGMHLSNNSGTVFGGHQKFNRVAHRVAKSKLPDFFPSIEQILHFEGRKGPDALKHKSPGKDEPQHFYDPFDPEYTDLLDHFRSHYQDLVTSLKAKDTIRASFDAAWLSHVITDGLTPAHHFPYEQELAKLRSHKKADSVRTKVMIQGVTKVDSLKLNWKFLGAKGLLMTHGLFEFGVSAICKPHKIHSAGLNDFDIKTLDHIGIEEIFKRTAREIALLDMYDRFYQRGWTPSLARDVVETLAPLTCKIVALAWISAANEADAS